MSIWRDHVTVIVYGYIKYINGIEDEYLEPDCAQMANKKNRPNEITKWLKYMNYLTKKNEKSKKCDHVPVEFMRNGTSTSEQKNHFISLMNYFRHIKKKGGTHTLFLGSQVKINHLHCSAIYYCLYSILICE